MLKGVRLARAKGVRRLVVETDSQDVFHALSRPQPGLSYFGRVVEEVNKEISKLDHAKWSWVRYTGNAVAHSLAQFTFHCNVLFVLNSIPDRIVPDVDIAAIEICFFPVKNKKDTISFFISL